MKDAILNRLGRHFAAMGAVTAAVVGAGVQNADAAIVSSGVVNIPIPVNVDGVYLNVITGATATTGPSLPGWDVNPFSATSLNFFNPAAPAGGVYVLRTGGGAPGNLPLGTLIDVASVYGSGAVSNTGNQPFLFSSTSNIVGFRFLNEITATTNYGWMRIEVGTTFTDATRKIVEYAYEDSGAGIQAGAVPAPACASLLVLGAGAAGRRRRNR